MYVKVTGDTAERYSIGQLRRENPNVSFPADFPEQALAQFGVFPLDVPPPPDFDTLLQIREEGPIQRVQGRWTQTYVVRDKTPEELEADAQAAATVGGDVGEGLLDAIADLVIALRDGEITAATREELIERQKSTVLEFARSRRGLP